MFSKIKKVSTKINIVNSFTLLIVGVVFFLLIPIVLNYPPGTVNTKFQTQFQPKYYQQYLLNAAVTILVMGILTKILLRKLDRYIKLYNEEPKAEYVSYIRKKCLTFPFNLSIAYAFIPIVVLFVDMIIVAGKGENILCTIRIASLIFTLFSLFSVISYIFSKSIFTDVLIKTYSGQEIEGKKITLNKKLSTQMVIIIMTGILFTTLIGHSRIVREKSDILFDYYNNQLEEKSKLIKENMNIEQVQDILKGIKLREKEDSTFIIDSNSKVITSDNVKLSNFYLKYVQQLAPQYNGRAYEYYAVDIQGATKKILLNGQEVIIGIKYAINSNQTLLYFYLAFIVLVLMQGGILFYFSKSISDDIKLVTEGLTDIVRQKGKTSESNIPVVSNDEIGELVVAFNQIQKLQKDSLKDIADKNVELEAQNNEIIDLNLKLKTLAERDGLTGVYNRRFFNEYFAIEMQRALNQVNHKPEEKHQMNFAMAILDIDDFKKINDTYGHLVGDCVLKQMVEIIQNITFSRDIVCRYGGEEFAIIFTKTEREGAIQASEKIRQEIENYKFFFNDEVKEGHLTISIGFSCFNDDFKIGEKDILQIADERLYLAKTSGKNKVVFEG